MSGFRIGKGVRLNWDVRLGVFPKGLIEEAFESFRELIYRIIDNNTLDISLESILPKAVRKSDVLLIIRGKNLKLNICMKVF